MSLILGILITTTISGFSFLYLNHLETEKNQKFALYDFFESLDLRFNDFKYKLAASSELKDQQTILVAIDDDSIDEVGRWPWSRTHITDMSEKLISYGVKSIGFDIIFSEPERENINADQILTQFVDKNQTKIVLGTFSDNLIHTIPYQDYCVNEAFLKNGGENLIKINPSFVVDDTGDRFEDLDWGNFFAYFFNAIQKNAEQNYLSKNKALSIANLTEFQKNYLKSLKVKKVFEYCTNWLTENDGYSDLKDPAILGLYKNLFSKSNATTEASILALLGSLKTESTEHPIPQYGRWTSNTELIQKSSLYTGSFNTKLDVDGFIRRYPLFYRAGNRLGSSFIPSLALQQYLVSTGYRADVKIEKIGSTKKITSFIIKDPSHDPETIVQVLPVDSKGQLLINYYGPRLTLQSVSAKELFSNDPYVQVYERASMNDSKDAVIKVEKLLKTDFFKNKNILFGATAMALYDLRNTPIDTNFPGPEIHQTVINNLLNQHYFYRPVKEKFYLPIFLLFYGMLFSLILYREGALNSALVLVAFILIGSITDYYLFLYKKMIISSIFFPLTTFAIFLSVLIYKYLSEERKKIELRKIFSKYVAPAVVDELLKDSKNLELGGRKQIMTAYFSDIRGFTVFSEKMDPQTLSQVLTEYLTPMTEIVFRNKGTLDKYMGDAIMAFFGAPVNYKEHARQACLSALESIAELNKINIAFQKKGWPQISIGIGINTGEMSVGNMGSQIVQNYTIMGDAVNLASRLEGATKEYGVKILISEATKKHLDESIVTRYVDTLRVKGKSLPVEIYEVLSRSENFTESDNLKIYSEAMAFYKNKNFVDAKNIFSILSTKNAADSLTQMYILRCEDFINDPPPDNWDGVFDLKTK
ncbi:MAG: adenylate/guanylate cyclase domain-containing protein [Pseudobdellovibrio sp.]